MHASSNHREEKKERKERRFDDSHSFPRMSIFRWGEETTHVCASTFEEYTLAVMLVYAFWLKCSSFSLLYPFSLRSTSLSSSFLPVPLLFSLLPPRDPGYTLAAAAPRSVFRVQGGANLQRVGASQRSQARCHCLATVVHREKQERECGERRERERERRAIERARSIDCSATMSSLIVPSTSNQRQRCIVAVLLTNRTTRLSTHLPPVHFSLSIGFSLPAALCRKTIDVI